MQIDIKNNYQQKSAKQLREHKYFEIGSCKNIIKWQSHQRNNTKDYPTDDVQKNRISLKRFH